MFPVEEVAGFVFGEEFMIDEGQDEAVAEEFGEGFQRLCGGGGEKMEGAWCRL